MTTTWLFVALLVLAGVATLALLGVGVYVVFLSPDALRWYALRRQARALYEQARGTAHRRLLATGMERRLTELRRKQSKLSATEKELARLHQRRQEELEQALATWIVNQRLTEVSGIGSTLAREIRRQVFRDSLRDLHGAYRVQGVGSVKQSEISRWIQYYDTRFGELLERDFPGKEDILADYRLSIKAKERRIAQLTKEIERLQAPLHRAERVLRKLEAVSETDFLRLLTDNTQNASPELDFYVRGVFAEWEPIPDWFRELVGGEESRA